MSPRARLHARSSRTQRPAKSLWERDSQRWYAARYARSVRAWHWKPPASSHLVRNHHCARTVAPVPTFREKVVKPRVGAHAFPYQQSWLPKVSTEVSSISRGFCWKPARRTAFFWSERSERSPPLGKHPMNERNSRDLGWWTQHSVAVLPLPAPRSTLTML